nr:flagellar basal body L-ring protein FlgH [Candidatus Liberibacter sp.]
MSCHKGAIFEMRNVPRMSPIGSGLRYETILRPSAGRLHSTKKSYSLWRDSQSVLFKGTRAINMGDILTVEIRMDDKAIFDNKTGQNRSNSVDKKLSGGFSILNTSPKANANLEYKSDSSASGKGSISRAEKLELLIAAVVTEILENGNLIISGSQEVRVNNEIRSLNITGVVRPQDVDAHNSISYDKIAEARISYGGKGHITEIQKAPIGQRFLDVFLPF